MGQSTNAGEVRSVTLATETKYGLPEGTLYKIAGIESSHTADAVSPKGAKGWFGFMPKTAKEYGVTDPTNLAEAADGAGRFMRKLLDTHDGKMDEALAYYNGGHKAVKALRAGNPWAETKDYLAKFGADAQPAAPAPMGEQFTSQTSVSPTDGPLASKLNVEQRQHDVEFGGVGGFVSNLPHAISLGFQTQNSVWNFYKERGLAQADGTPIDWDNADNRKAFEAVPQRHWDYVLQSTTQEELGRRMGRIQDTMQKEQELGGMGLGLALTGGIAGTLPDLPTLIGFIPGVGGAGLLTKASRLQNAIRLGAVGAATNVAYDAAMMKYMPTATTDDLYVSALFGLGLGALSGGAANLNKIALHQENQRLRAYGLQKGTEGMKGEIPDMPKVPGVEPVDIGAKIDKWKGGQPPDPVPKILTTPPPAEAPKARPVEAPKVEAPAPKVAPVEPVEAPANPSGKPWDASWDKPVYTTRMGAKDIMILPPMKRVSELAQYIREKSKNPDFVALMDRALKSIDLRKLKFDVIDPDTPLHKLAVGRDMKAELNGAYGLVRTPWGSAGDDVEMALRGLSWGHSATGLNEETFIHEVVHVATVYKARRVAVGDIAGMKPETVQGYKELNGLFGNVRNSLRTANLTNHPASRVQGVLLNPELGSNAVLEFITYGLTNRPFQDWLKTVQVDGPRTTLWNRFTNSLRKMLGFTAKDMNAYTRLLDLSASLLDKSGIEGKAKKPNPNAYEGKAVTVSADTVHAAEAADIPPVFGLGLGLEHRLMGANIDQKVRNLASKLIGSTVGHKNHAVVQGNAWEGTLMRSEGWAAETRKVAMPAFDAWFKESKRAWHERDDAFTEFGEQVGNFIRGFPGDHHPEAVRAGRKIQEVMARVVDEINNPAHRDGGTKRGLTEVEVPDETTGQTMLVGKLDKNASYLPRKHDTVKWNSMVSKFGREAVESWWANAYAKAHPERSAEDARKWAGWYVKTVEEAHLNRTADHLEEMMSGYDERALRESLMRNGGFTEHEAISIVQGMFQNPANDAGRTASSLRHRNHINETHVETWALPGGESVRVSLNDFINSNAFAVAESYYRRVASSISLANHLDIYKQSDIGRLIDEATLKQFGDTTPDHLVKRTREDLKFAVERIQGIPQEETTALNKSLAMWRDFNVIRLMGGAVWNQMSELSQIVGTMGWKATLAANKELTGLRRDLITGKAPHEFLDHLENTIGGVGSEYVARLEIGPDQEWTHLLGEGKKADRLNATAGGLRKVAKGVLDYTGMTGVMVQQKRIHAIALTNHIVDVAHGAASRLLTKDRLAWMGLSEADHADLNAAIRTYSKPGKGEFGKKWDWDFKAFAEAEPELHSKLMRAIHRESRRVIQENDLASMVPIMGTTLGQTVFQFMNFVIHGWNKSLLFSMNHRDFTTFSTVMHGSLMASLAYMGRTHMSAMGMSDEKRQEFLDKRLSGKQIVANSFGKISQMSLIPQFYDTTLGNFTGPMFSGMRTTSDLSSIASNPTLQAVEGFLSMGKMVRNGFSDEVQTTERDVRTWGRLAPLNNIVPISTLINAIANDYPYSDKQED